MAQLTTLTGAPVSAACFGTMQFGGNADEAASTEMYAACRNAGINFFDTAWVYTGGRSEEILGRLIATERDKVYVATKCAAKGGGGRANILSQFEESRRRLNQDVVDLLYLHRWNDEPLEETFGTLADLVAAGQVRHIGVSNFAAWQTMKAAAIAARLGIEISVLQPMYNLVKRQAEVEILPMARSEGFAVCPYSPLGGGLLTGKYASGAEGRLTTDEMYRARYGQDWMFEAAARLAVMAGELGVAPATLAVAWVRRNSDITAPIISARSLAQLEPSLAGLSFALDDALYQRISALSPTPPPATDRSEEA